MDITEKIKKYFDFLCDEGFICSVIANNLEKCIIYKAHEYEIVVTYDLREHIIDVGIADALCGYYPMSDIICQNASNFLDSELSEFEARYGGVVTHKNIEHTLEWLSKFVSVHLRDLIKIVMNDGY